MPVYIKPLYREIVTPEKQNIYVVEIDTTGH